MFFDLHISGSELKSLYNDALLTPPSILLFQCDPEKFHKYWDSVENLLYIGSFLCFQIFGVGILFQAWFLRPNDIFEDVGKPAPSGLSFVAAIQKMLASIHLVACAFVAAIHPRLPPWVEYQVDSRARLRLVQCGCR